MIGWLHGIVRHKKPPYLLIDVHGVGYELEAPMTTFNHLPDTEESIGLYIHHLVREDTQSLFAFVCEYDRNLFRQLLRINGIGAKLGLTILSGMNAEELKNCVHNGDTRTLSRLPGIGKRTAERLVIELRDRLDNIRPQSASTAERSAARLDPTADAVSALVALGLKPPEASRRVGTIQAAGLTCEEIVRLALQSMVGK